jgi:hypothetical protein
MNTKCGATQRNKWQQKRLKTDDGKTLNVNHVLMDWRQGAKRKTKSLPSMFKYGVFLIGG